MAVNASKERLTHIRVKWDRANALGGADGRSRHLSDSQVASTKVRTEPQLLSESGRTRIWPLEQAEQIVWSQLHILPELREQLATLIGGLPGLIKPIVEVVADGVSYDPGIEMTGEVFRKLSGAPLDESQLDAWRQTLYYQYKDRHAAQANA
jgi:hypothetical protein